MTNRIELSQIYTSESPEAGSLIPMLPDIPDVDAEHVLNDMHGGNAPRISLQNVFLKHPGLLWLTQMCCYRCVDEAVEQATEHGHLPEVAVEVTWIMKDIDHTAPDADAMEVELKEAFPDAVLVSILLETSSQPRAVEALRKLDQAAANRYHLMRNKHHYLNFD